jgi:peptide/nickel transport system permease protein
MSATDMESVPGRTETKVPRRVRIYLAPAALLILAIAGPWITPWSATEVVGTPLTPPGQDYWFGTDSSGLDIFSRVIASTRNDVQIALFTAIVATAVGLAVGLGIGMNEAKSGVSGLLARFAARSLDVMQAIPSIVIGLSLVALFGASTLTMTLALAVILFPNQARLVRTEVLRVRGEQYLDSARMAGLSELQLTIRHVMPNSSWPALENISVVFSSAIMVTAALGFLGVGLAPPTPEWGSMISAGASDAAVGRWWPAFFPAIAMMACVFAVAGAGHHLFGRPKS